MTPRVELLWFAGCANHPAARRLLEQAIAEIRPGVSIIDLDATDPQAAGRLRFPGSPTIRVDGRDIDPSFVDPGDYTPRCRLYRTADGLRGLPERRWIEDALRAASAAHAANRRGASVPRQAGLSR
ncbi:MAG: DF family (seleno)protein [Solirubrobacterales bacterium]